jgi:hypothetical protein
MQFVASAQLGIVVGVLLQRGCKQTLDFLAQLLDVSFVWHVEPARSSPRRRVA